MIWSIVGLMLWNLVVFGLYGWDKRQARLAGQRISERCLILCALLLGGIGAYCGMSVWRHKTRHLKFRLFLPITFLYTLGVALYLFWKGISMPA